MALRYEYLVSVLECQLPLDIFHRYHYFRTEKTARRFIDELECSCQFAWFEDGATFLKPVCMVVFDYIGELFEGEYVFPYETMLDDVNEAWLDGENLGCDCARSDIIIRAGQGDFDRLKCGRRVKLIGMYVDWQTDKTEMMLHGA